VRDKFVLAKFVLAKFVLAKFVLTLGTSVEDWMAGNDMTTKIFGGSPLAVLGRLVLLSILVGVVLSTFGVDPLDIFRSMRALIESIWNMGFRAIEKLWGYLVIGAIIVIPIWLITRIFNAPRGR
jgi:hypothetical protein